MRIYAILKNYSRPFLLTLLFLPLCYNTLRAQGNPVAVKGYGKASYNPSQQGKFMRTWLVAGPIAAADGVSKPDDAQQEAGFKNDLLSQVNIKPGVALAPLSLQSKQIKWQFINSADDFVDLDSFYKRKDFVYAYALAEIKTDAAANVLLAVGSDDGIKVWHNGKLVHNNWIPRGITKDEDLIPLKLVKGSNQLLLKVQDMEYGWGFVARLLDKAALTKMLNVVASTGAIDKINMLVENGADVNAADESGMSPIMAAKIAGRDEVVQLLKEKGARDANVPSGETITNAFYHSLAGKDVSGIAVLVAKDGNILTRKGFGYADIKNKIPVTPDTKFRIGSVTKQFTGAAILKLQENNLLSVNDKLSKFIPDFPRGDEVTIHHLLTHTSGIHSYTSRNDFINRVTATISPDSLVRLIKGDPYDFNPGEQFSYNNSGYFLLGYIIAKVSGKTYAGYLQATFFDPLGMKNTGIHYAGIKLSNEAKGYSRNAYKYEEALNWDMSWAGAAGAMYSTVDDLLKWNQALYGGKVLQEKSMKAALAPVTLTTGKETSMQYGYGLVLSKFRGQDIISHGGGLHGFVTHLTWFPKEKLSVVMFSNNGDPEVNFDDKKIAEAFLWDKMDKQSSFAQITVSPEKLKALTGRYAITNLGVMTISTAGDKLFAQLSGQSKYEIFPSSETEFFWKVVEAQIKFTKDPQGEITHATIYQGGQEIKAEKLEEEKIVQIDPSVLDKYTGKYKVKDMTVVLTKENNKLFAQADGESKMEMLPVSETDFVIKEINAKIYFVKETDGKVNKFKLNMNGADSEVMRIE